MGDYLRRIILFLFFLLGLAACSGPQDPLPESIGLIKVPANFPALTDFSDNPLSAKGVELGRQLFYDTGLSSNGKVSCATCHLPSKAFTDGRTLTNAGVSGKALVRHSPTLINLAWSNNGLFWDGGSKNLESQALGPLTHQDEMGQNLNAIVAYLSKQEAYPIAFSNAFPGEAISYVTVAKALAQFQRTLVSADSRYDHWIRKEGETLTSLERQGYTIFQQKCATCHSTDLFTDNDYHNNGLDSHFSDEGEGELLGRMRITFSPNDLGKYRTPTLRNSALTAPYMHDGRFATLESVVEHYSEGIVGGSTTDLRLPIGGFHFDDNEKAALLAFLATLTDNSFVTNSLYQKP